MQQAISSGSPAVEAEAFTQFRVFFYPVDGTGRSMAQRTEIHKEITLYRKVVLNNATCVEKYPNARNDQITRALELPTVAGC